MSQIILTLIYDWQKVPQNVITLPGTDKGLPSTTWFRQYEETTITQDAGQQAQHETREPLSPPEKCVCTSPPRTPRPHQVVSTPGCNDFYAN